MRTSALHDLHKWWVIAVLMILKIYDMFIYSYIYIYICLYIDSTVCHERWCILVPGTLYCLKRTYMLDPGTSRFNEQLQCQYIDIFPHILFRRGKIANLVKILAKICKFYRIAITTLKMSKLWSLLKKKIGM